MSETSSSKEQESKESAVREDIYQAFKLYDRDGNDLISPDDVGTVLRF